MSFNLAQSDFRGGEWSSTAQGNFMDKSYKISLGTSANGYPITPGAWMRRQGTMHDGFTNSGNPGRIFTFEFEDAAPYNVELTSGRLRFWASNGQGLSLATTNDSVAVSAISASNPCEVTLSAQPSTGEWQSSTNGTATKVFFTNLGTNNPLLQNRVFYWTAIDGTHGTLTDDLTGANIDGSTLGTFVSGTINRAQKFLTPFIGTLATLNNVRSVQTEEAAILLGAGVAPQALYFTEGIPYNQFSTGAVTFEDGPYLDPPGLTGAPSAAPGTLLVPNATQGSIQLTIQFQQWNPGQAYQEGEFVTAGSINYESLVNNNLGNALSCTFSGSSSPTVNVTNTFSAGNQVIFQVTGGALPAALTAGTVYYVISANLSTSVINVSATSGGAAIDMATAGTGTMTVALAPGSQSGNWAAVSSSAQAVNNGAGFTATDIGRLIRLKSAPALWNSNSSYSTGAVVAYNPGIDPDQTTYWSSLVNSNVNHIPGTDIVNWQLIPPGAVGTGTAAPFIWTWGQITSLATSVPGSPANVAQIGNMTGGGGLSAAFNGNSSQNAAASAELGSSPTNAYVGNNFAASSPSSYAIQSATLFPSTDEGFCNTSVNTGDRGGFKSGTITAYLYGSNSSPSSATNGTLLGSIVIASLGVTNTSASYGTSPVTISSSDTATAYTYLWVVLGISFVNVTATTWTAQIAQVQFQLASGGSTTGNGITIELLGPPLLYTQQIRNWQLGLFSGTTGYPTCGTYSDGRVWLGGVLGNRFDTSCSNGILVEPSGVTINMAPTDIYGNVLASSAISETFNTPGVNPIFWMEPDQQGVLMGTQAGEHLVFAPSAGGFSPDNIDERRVTKIRCAPILPVRCEHTLAFVQTHTRTLVEYFPDVFSGKFTAPHLSEKWDHLTVTGIAELAYQQELAPIIWGRTNDGRLIGATYKRDTLMTSQGPTFIGAHHHPLGSGNTVVSICTGPSEGGTLDALSMVTFDGTYYHVETLTDMFEEGDTISNAWFLDNAIVPSSYTTDASNVYINGLWHLNGQTVTCFAGTLDCGDFPVTNGSITVPYGANAAFTSAYVSAYSGAMPIIVGFTYISQGQLHRPIEPQETGNPTGPTLSQKRTVKRFGAYMINTQGISFGTSFSNLHAFTFKSPGNIPYASNQLFTGVGYRDSLADSWSYDGQICWQISRPWPACIGAIEGEINVGRD